MKTQSILATYKNIPANSIRAVKTGMVIKGENSIIHIVPNLKREIMVQVGDTFSTGFSFYENSSMAEFHQNTMTIRFNANDLSFLKQHLSEQRFSKNTMPLKHKIIKTNKNLKEKPEKQKYTRIDINDRFKDFLKDLPFNDRLYDILAPVYMNIRMLCKEPLIMYSHFFQKDFFNNKPKARIVSESEMAEFQRQKEKQKLD